MKIINRFCSLLLLILCPLFLFSQDKLDMTELLGKARGIPKTSVEYDKKVWNFGNVKEEIGMVEVLFYVKNTGQKPLLIVGVKPSCECTVSEWTRDSILPGKSGFIKAVYETTGRPGPINTTVGVVSNDISGTLQVLELTGEVIPRELTAEDSFPVQMGSLRFTSTYFAWGAIKSNSSAKAYIGVYNEGLKPITIKSYTGIKDFIKISGEGAVIQPKGRLILEADLNAKKCEEFGIVTLFGKMFTDDEMLPEKDVHGSATIEEYFPKMSRRDSLKAPKVSIVSPVYNFGTIREGSVVNHEFEIKNIGKKDLLIHKAISGCGCTVADLPKKVLKPGESMIIKVTFDSQGKKEFQSRTVNILVNDPVSPNNPLIMQGIVTENK